MDPVGDAWCGCQHGQGPTYRYRAAGPACARAGQSPQRKHAGRPFEYLALVRLKRRAIEAKLPDSAGVAV